MKRLFIISLMAVFLLLFMTGSALADEYYIADGASIYQTKIKARIGTPAEGFGLGTATRKAFIAKQSLWYEGAVLKERTAEVGWAFYPGYGTPKSYIQYYNINGQLVYTELSNYPYWGFSRVCEIVYSGYSDLWHLYIGGDWKASHFAHRAGNFTGPFWWGARTSNSSDPFRAPMTEMQNDWRGLGYENNMDPNAYGLPSRSPSLYRQVVHPYYAQIIYR